MLIKLKKISPKDKVKADLLKIDIENLSKFGDRDYSTEEIMNICKKVSMTYFKRIHVICFTLTLSVHCPYWLTES